MYKNILNRQIEEFNANYKKIFKNYPSLSIEDKRRKAYVKMIKDRGFNEDSVLIDDVDPASDSRGFQYRLECYLTYMEVYSGITRYYIKDESLFEFFKSTEVKKKEIKSILDLEMMKLKNEFFVCGVLGKEQSYTVVCTDFKGQHIVSVLTDDMNYTFCIEQFNDEKLKWVFNLAMNFIFYINAFPECVVDGVPSGTKRIEKSRTISITDKIVSHTTTEHGFVRPHFRSGYFRHFNSDYFVNCKGQVRFIASTMVKGKAKTVISREV